MTPFTYTYNEKECDGNFLPSDKGRGWIKVMFFDHSATVLPTSIRTKNNKTIWVQTVQPGEYVWPHDLIQALGEAVEVAIQ
jgi:hypothetical protein